MAIPLPVIHSTTITTSTISLILNIRLIFNFYYYNKNDKRHFSALFLCLYSQLCFNVSSLVYASQCLTGALTDNWSAAGVFWSGDLTFSFTFSIVTCNFCIAVDRIVAMRKPFQYAAKYSPLCQNICIVLMIVSFGGACLRYSIGIQLEPATAPSISYLTKPGVLNCTSIARNVLSFISIASTLVFLREVALFLKKQHKSHSSKGIKKANRVVLLQLIAETALMIFPDLAFPFSGLIGVNLIGIVGPVSIPFSALYTLACALLLTMQFRRSKVVEVTVVSSSVASVSK
ncbi:hypothetical protein QR680_015789 [Steinernema hermaphroditum]|uniref:Uncharacterized protein n=1 Tax=Steinernema hermaphroditum TaxID=289476 RepID=A0AA39LLC3_9BILA|nr:hypothetical protein QR680_015789 [Steinernema hermaphroditum]